MVYALLISLILAGFTVAQQPAAGEASTLVKAMPAVNKLISAAGRFTIALAKDTAEFEAIGPTSKSPRESGGKYSWSLKEGVIMVEYSDDPDLVFKTDKDYSDLAEGMRAGVVVFGGKVLAEKAFKLGIYRGHEIRFEDPNKLKGISRTLIVNGRMYTMFGLARADATGAIEFMTKAFDSFELITTKP